MIIFKSDFLSFWKKWFKFSFEYNGPREANGIVKYMLEQSRPAAKKMSNLAEIEKFMSKDDVTIVGFFASEDSTTFEAYSDSAEMLREVDF